MSASVAIAVYRPHQGQEKALTRLVNEHQARLRALHLITGHPAIVMRAKDGALVEVFEWRSDDAKRHAHEDPEMVRIWRDMSEVADFPPLAALEESQAPFASFATVTP
ncbi:MAG TPA: hypothetical protein V6D47_12860 [Oscillatoriaceae cyanobacterium]